jgi:hypothetical protein
MSTHTYNAKMTSVFYAMEKGRERLLEESLKPVFGYCYGPISLVLVPYCRWRGAIKRLMGDEWGDAEIVEQRACLPPILICSLDEDLAEGSVYAKFNGFYNVLEIAHYLINTAPLTNHFLQMSKKEQKFVRNIEKDCENSKDQIATCVSIFTPGSSRNHGELIWINYDEQTRHTFLLPIHTVECEFSHPKLLQE